jgi:putative DNA primase/helicase
MAGNSHLIGFLQRAVGYSLTGDTSERVLFILYGTGANGKTTLLETIRYALGDYALRTPVITLMSRRGDAVPNDVARLKGARLVSASEFEEGRRLAEGLVKDLTGGDTVSARFMRAEWFDFKPECKVWLGTNHKPLIRGSDNAIWDRIRLIPFNVRIPEQEQDKHLAQKLQLEAAGILAWAVQGCLQWQESGLDNPSEVSDATQTYRNEMDILADFIEDCCVENPKAEVTVKALHQAFVEWCDRNGEKPMTKTKLGLRLKEKGFTPGRQTGSTARVWKGIGLLSQGAESPPTQGTLNVPG